MVITLSDHTQIRVPAVTVGTHKFFAFAVGKGRHAVRWTTYDSDRREIATDRTPPGI